MGLRTNFWVLKLEFQISKKSKILNLIKLYRLLWSTTDDSLIIDNGKLSDGLDGLKIARRMISPFMFLLFCLLIIFTVFPVKLNESSGQRLYWKRGRNSNINLYHYEDHPHKLTLIWTDLRRVSYLMYHGPHMFFGHFYLSWCWNTTPLVPLPWREDVIQIGHWHWSLGTCYTGHGHHTQRTPGHCDGHCAGSDTQYYPDIMLPPLTWSQHSDTLYNTVGRENVDTGHIKWMVDSTHLDI